MQHQEPNVTVTELFHGHPSFQPSSPVTCLQDYVWHVELPQAAAFSQIFSLQSPCDSHVPASVLPACLYQIHKENKWPSFPHQIGSIQDLSLGERKHCQNSGSSVYLCCEGKINMLLSNVNLYFRRGSWVRLYPFPTTGSK